VGKFFPVVMVLDKGDAESVLGLFYSQFCYVLLSVSQVKVKVNTCESYKRWLKIIRKLY
jgi:hypothetical protein